MEKLNQNWKASYSDKIYLFYFVKYKKMGNVNEKR